MSRRLFLGLEGSLKQPAERGVETEAHARRARAHHGHEDHHEDREEHVQRELPDPEDLEPDGVHERISFTSVFRCTFFFRAKSSDPPHYWFDLIRCRL